MLIYVINSLRFTFLALFRNDSASVYEALFSEYLRNKCDITANADCVKVSLHIQNKKPSCR